MYFRDINPLQFQYTEENLFNTTGESYQSLGERIISSIKYGSAIDAGIKVDYDDDDVDSVDILGDLNHDFFDVAEHNTMDRTGDNVPASDDLHQNGDVN